MTVTFRVHGTPMPQGSMKAVARKGTNHPIVVASGGLKFGQWRNAVAEAASRAAAEHGSIEGPVGLVVDFCFAMPKSRPAGTRNKGWAHKTTAPDLDKLVRCIADALVAGGLLADDAQIALVQACKWETTDAPHASITLGSIA